MKPVRIRIYELLPANVEEVMTSARGALFHLGDLAVKLSLTPLEPGLTQIEAEGIIPEWPGEEQMLDCLQSFMVAVSSELR